MSPQILDNESTMFGFLRPNPEKKLSKKIAAKRQQAVALQRSGKLRQAADLIKEADTLEDELLLLRNSAK